MDFLSASEPYVDPHYAQKVWKQGQELSKDDRREFLRKVSVFLAWAKRNDPRAGPLYHEISGFVNDRGAMTKLLTTQEIKRRRDFILEDTGQLDHT